MRQYLILLLAVTWNVSIVSQNVREIELVVNKAIGDTDFVCVEVIDKRLDTSGIGYVQTGIVNNHAKAVLQRDFETTLYQALRELLPFGPGKDEFVFIVHRLRIAENTVVVETGSCEIEIEIARKKDSQLYSIGFFESRVQDKGLDVTNGHGRRIIRALSDCIETFRATYRGDNSEPLIPVTEKKYSLNYKSLPAPGAYYSFGQMARNQPLQHTEVRITLPNPASKIEKYICYTKGNPNVPINYIVDSQSVYINAGDFFLKAKHYGRYLYFETRNGDSQMALYFGLIGALASFQRTGFILDTETGAFTELNEYTLAKIARAEHPDVLKVYRQTKRKDADLESALVMLNKKYLE